MPLLSTKNRKNDLLIVCINVLVTGVSDGFKLMRRDGLYSVNRVVDVNVNDKPIQMSQHINK